MWAAFLLLALGAAATVSEEWQPRPLLPVDRRVVAKEITAWSNYRQQTVLPSLMDQYNVSAWVMASHEYNEDPAFWAIWPGVGLRNCTDPMAFVTDLDQACLNDQVNGDRITVFVRDEATGRVGRHVSREWQEVATWLRAAVVGVEPGPRLVLDNGAARFQGLSAGAFHSLSSALGSAFMATYVYDPFAAGSAGYPHPLPWDFVELRVPPEADPTMLHRYRQLQETSRAAQRFGLSRHAIRPGVTTTEDLNWLLVQLAERRLDLRTTSSPAVQIFRRGSGWLSGPRAVIREGDMLRSDWGLRGFGDVLWSDNTMLGYVGAQPDGELRDGLAKANRVQGFWLESCEACAARGCTGQEWVAEIGRRVRGANWTLGDEGCGTGGEPRCDAAVFSHPIGDFMHSAGPYIKSSGSRRRQGRHIGGRRHRSLRASVMPELPSSDWRALRVRPNTWFAMELAAFGPWGESWAEFNLEQQVRVTSDGRCEPLLPLQREFLLVASEEDASANSILV